MIVISVREIDTLLEKEKESTWEHWVELFKVSNIMYDTNQLVLFRAEKDLGFSCQKSYRRCGGDQKVNEYQLSKEPGLQQLNNCMQCSFSETKGVSQGPIKGSTRGSRRSK